MADVSPELARWPGPVPMGLPSELLERRPDVVAAERRVASAFHRTEEARAARLPSISLTGSFTDLSSDLFELKERDNPVWSGGARLLAPLFSGGSLRTQVRIRSAEQRFAIADYGRVGARAFGEVESALAAERTAGRREQVLSRAATENQRALDLARVRYDVGSGDLRQLQQQQVAVHSSRAELVRMQSERLVQRVNLHLALGVMNIMLVSVIERTREIGIRMAVGAKPFDVMTQFLVESIVLAFIGGVLGLGFGALLAKFMAGYYEWKFTFPAATAAIAFGVAGGVGVVFGFYPAMRASQLDPIQALRYES